ncbi:hypothetical protein [Psychrobacillus sp. FSL H8-0510]|uniref:hypothetical protein n=1 Tax=Psychrobacillus sp. FSL H8-0510 TaxID=2921394 RepID=UPI0030F9E526
MEFKKGDIVETTYNNITNRIGEIIAIYERAVTIIGMEGEVSHHKKELLRIVKND